MILVWESEKSNFFAFFPQIFYQNKKLIFFVLWAKVTKIKKLELKCTGRAERFSILFFCWKKLNYNKIERKRCWVGFAQRKKNRKKKVRKKKNSKKKKIQKKKFEKKQIEKKQIEKKNSKKKNE